MNMSRLFCGLSLLMLAAPSLAAETVDCHIGSYRLTDGRAVDIAPLDDGALRWRLLDGTTGALQPGADGRWTSTRGWTKEPDGVAVSFSDCAGGEIHFNGISGKRILFDVKDVTFISHGAKLAGRLVMPAGTAKAPVVVLVHGSEPDSALTGYSLQRVLPAMGIGAFVYDKRGTGISGGTYTQDFDTLADDVDAAVAEARSLAGARLGRIGLQGGSEGGWVAPLAANHAKVDFVIVCFGLAVNVIEEDQESIELQMREKGYSPEIIAEAQEVGHAAEKLFMADFKGSYEEYDAMKAKYQKEPWYKDVQGDFTWLILPHTDDELRAMAKDFDWHTPFYYDSMAVLRANTTPQLWIVGGEDYDAPSAETSMRIKSLITDGKPFTLAYYPKAEHGMTLFETEPDGTRDSTRYAVGYYDMLRDFAKDGRLSGSYGDAQISGPPAAAH